MVIGFILIGVIFVLEIILGIYLITRCVRVKQSGVFLKKKMSLEELANFVESMDFYNMVEAYAKNQAENLPTLPTEDTGGWSICNRECGGQQCFAYRELDGQCPKDVEIGGKHYCRTYINLNKLCNVEPYSESIPDNMVPRDDLPPILSDEQCKELAEEIAKAITKYNKETAKLNKKANRKLRWRIK